LVATVVLAACGGAFGPVSVGDATLLRHEPSDAYPSALGVGALSLLRGCVALVPDRGEPAFVLWPPDYDLIVEDGAWLVVTDQGGAVGREGGTVRLGGGFMDLGPALEVTDGGIPPACRTDANERYFLTSGPADTP
jgi:hypothetical protein